MTPTGSFTILGDVLEDWAPGTEVLEHKGQDETGGKGAAVLNDAVLHQERYLIEPMIERHLGELGQQWTEHLNSGWIKTRNLFLQRIHASINQFEPDSTQELRYRLRLELEAWVWKQDHLYGHIRGQQDHELKMAVLEMLKDYTATQNGSTSECGSKMTKWGQDLWCGTVSGSPAEDAKLEIVICHELNKDIQIFSEDSCTRLMGEPSSEAIMGQIFSQYSESNGQNLYALLPACLSRLSLDGEPQLSYAAASFEQLKSFASLVQFLQQNEREFLFYIPASIGIKGKLVLLPYRYVLEWGMCENLGSASLVRPMDQFLVAVFVSIPE